MKKQYIIYTIRRTIQLSLFLMILSSCETRMGRTQEINGHEYRTIQMDGIVTIIHDPDCKCKEKQ